jgi:hypothetical protein
MEKTFQAPPGKKDQSKIWFLVFTPVSIDLRIKVLRTLLISLSTKANLTGLALFIFSVALRGHN